MFDPSKMNSWLAVSRNPDVVKKLFENHLVDKVMKLWCYGRLVKMTLLLFLSLFIPKPQILVKILWTNLRRPIRIRGTPTLRLKNSVNIWNLLWLSRRLIISTERTRICISTVPILSTSGWAKNRHVSRQTSSPLYVTHRHNSEIHNVSLEKRKPTTTTTKAKENRLKRI